MTATVALQGATCYDIGDGYWFSFEELVLTLGLKSLATANNGGNGSVHCYASIQLPVCMGVAKAWLVCWLHDIA